MSPGDLGSPAPRADRAAATTAGAGAGAGAGACVGSRWLCCARLGQGCGPVQCLWFGAQFVAKAPRPAAAPTWPARACRVAGWGHRDGWRACGVRVAGEAASSKGARVTGRPKAFLGTGFCVSVASGSVGSAAVLCSVPESGACPMPMVVNLQRGSCFNYSGAALCTAKLYCAWGYWWACGSPCRRETLTQSVPPCSSLADSCTADELRCRLPVVGPFQEAGHTAC